MGILEVLPREHIEAWVRAAGGRDWRVELVDYPFGTPTTLGAVRLYGDFGSLFVKVIRAYRHWPGMALMPAELRTQALASDLWRYEADLYADGVGALLPPGLRLPIVHAVTDLGDDHVAIVLEDVRVTDEPWDTSRFARAAGLLARAAVRITRADALPPSASRVPAAMLELFYVSRLAPVELPAWADDRTWAHPLLAPWEKELRSDLEALAERIPAILDRLRSLPQLMVHGDPSPQNLLVPVDAPDTFVAIDWSLGGIAPAGDDLGQLLIGLAHAGQLTANDLPALRETIVDSFQAGLVREGLAIPRADIAYGLDGGVLLRSTFTAVPFPRLSEPMTAELATLVQERLRLTRYLVDIGLRLPT